MKCPRTYNIFGQYRDTQYIYYFYFYFYFFKYIPLSSKYWSIFKIELNINHKRHKERLYHKCRDLFLYLFYRFSKNQTKSIFSQLSSMKFMILYQRLFFFGPLTSPTLQSIIFLISQDLHYFFTF